MPLLSSQCSGQLKTGHDVQVKDLAFSPDGRLLAASGKTSELVVIDPESRELRQRVSLPPEDLRRPPEEALEKKILDPDTKGQLSYTGLVFTPDGSRIAYTTNPWDTWIVPVLGGQARRWLPTTS